MSYNYAEQRPHIFTEEGQRRFLRVRDASNELLNDAGAFCMCAPMRGVAGDVWELMACVDRMVELGEIREITGPNVAGQDRVFVRKK